MMVVGITDLKGNLTVRQLSATQLRGRSMTSLRRVVAQFALGFIRRQYISWYRRSEQSGHSRYQSQCECLSSLPAQTLCRKRQRLPSSPLCHAPLPSLSPITSLTLLGGEKYVGAPRAYNTRSTRCLCPSRFITFPLTPLVVLAGTLGKVDGSSVE